MKDKIILKDGTAIEIESGSSLESVLVVSATKADMVTVWDMLTNDNIKEVTVKNSEGTIIGEYENLVLVSETSVVNTNGTVNTSFNLRQKTEIELRIEKLEESQADQDDAIVELAEIVAEG